MLRSRATLWVLCLAAGACKCGDGSLGGTAIGFTVSGATVDFGKVLEDAQESRTVTLISTGNVDLTVAISTSGSPFSAPSSILVPRGGSTDVAVVFTAGTTVADGTLTLSGHGQSVSVPLHGEGVKPLVCTASGPCQLSTFDIASDSCIQSQAANGTACVPISICLDNGQCQAGQCVGSPRNCDDDNACTVDECAEGQGCIHTPVSCPPPTALCQIATCNPSSGCGIGPGPDDVGCGGIDCINAHLCLAGACLTLPTPDGFLCAPSTPCRGPGRCHNQQCVLPDAGDMTPSFAQALTRTPALVPNDAPTLLAYAGNVFWAACDGGCALESSTFNGFQRFEQPFPDSRPRWLVAVTPTAVLVETADAIEAYDQGLGAPLWSFSSSALPAPPEAPGFVASTGVARAAVLPDGTVTAAFSWFAPPVDAGSQRVDGGASPDGGSDAGSDAGLDGGADAGGDAGSDADGGALDAGPLPNVQSLVRIEPDGGVLWTQWVRGQGTQSLLATDLLGALYLYDPAGPLASLDEADGGRSLVGLGSWPGAASFAAQEGTLLAGATWVVAADGGIGLGSLAPTDAGFVPTPDARNVVAARGEAFVLVRACLPPLTDPCPDVEKTTLVLALDLTSGALLWTSQVARSNAAAFVHEAAVVQGGGVCTLLETDGGLGPESHVQLFAAGQEAFDCRIPPPGVLGGAVFDSGRLYILINRGSGWWLESYDLSPVPFETTGWPERNSGSGTRHEL